MTEVVALVPARGGSQGVPRKNLRPLAGTPIVARAVACALAASSVDRVVVSTDDEEIAEVARGAGAEVPFLRPPELAGDETPDLPVYLHALAALDPTPDVVAWVRPTAPLRTPADLDAAVELLLESGADVVRSVCLAEHSPHWMRRLEDGRLLPLGDEPAYLRRQDLPPVYRLNGAVDVVRCSTAATTGSLFDQGDVRAYVMPPERSVDLDTELDFVVAEALLAR